MTRPLEWMAAVRDHPERPPATQRLVLHSLALRMDWQTGCGFASAAQLATDADCEERTVRRATGWARGAELLVQTRRGHRVSAERTISSEWRLAIPQSQPDTGDLLAADPTGQRRPANRTAGASQPDSSTPPSRPRSSRPRSSANGARADAPRSPADPETRFIAPPCPECGKPFSQEQLADPEFRQMALAGDVIHNDCAEANGKCRSCGVWLDDEGICRPCGAKLNGHATEGDQLANGVSQFDWFAAGAR